MRQSRKTNNAYDLYGFIPRIESGKHSAICKLCNRVLQNTAASRLLKHRNSCAAKSSRNRKIFEIIEGMRHKPPIIKEKQQEKHRRIIQQHQLVSLEEVKENGHKVQNVCNAIKIEEDDDSTANFNDETNYEPTINDMTNPVFIQHNTSSTRSSYQSNSSNHPQNSPEWIYITEHTENQTQCEIKNKTTSNLTTAVDIDDAGFEVESVDVSNLLNIDTEFDVIQNLMPRSQQSLQLLDELCIAETEYYNTKAEYFEKLTENTKIKRTLMGLKARKLQLEIENLTNVS